MEKARHKDGVIRIQLRMQANLRIRRAIPSRDILCSLAPVPNLLSADYQCYTPGAVIQGLQEMRVGAGLHPVPISVGVGISRNVREYMRVRAGKKKVQATIGPRHTLLSLRHPFAAFAHRARCAAAIFFRAATDILRFLGIATTFDLLPFDLAFAHRAF
jgi:hypothetical protein